MAKIPLNLSESNYHTPTIPWNPSYTCVNGWIVPNQLHSKTDILRSKMTKCQTNLVPKNFFSKNPVFFGPKNGQKWQKSPENIFFEIRPKFCNRRYMTRPYSKNLWKIDPRDPASPAAGKPEFLGKFRLRNFSSNIIPQLDAKFQKHPTVIQEVRKIDPRGRVSTRGGKPGVFGKIRAL